MMEMQAVGYRPRRAPRALVDDVSLGLHRGELLAVLGPNGAGKSTLMGLLAGDLAPTSGTVLLDGCPVTSLRPRELALQRAVLPQDTGLAFPFAARDVVRMGRAPHEPGADDDAVVDDCLAATDTLHLADRAYPSLSGGERARVSLARVLAQQAPVLLLDEPTAALDLRHTEDVLRLARERAHTHGDAVLAVLHDLNLAAAYADRVALLAEGRLVACGRPAEVLTGPTLTRLYGHPVDVWDAPSGGGLVVLPSR